MTGSKVKLGRRIRLAIIGACLATAVPLCTTAPAEAVQYTPHEFEKYFNGSPAATTLSGVSSIAVDQQTGDVYAVTTQSGLNLFKFNSEGEPLPFTDPAANGTNVLNMGVPPEDTCGCATPVLDVDNSGGPHQGRIYLDYSFIDSHVWAFEPSGAPVGGNFPLPYGADDMAVSPVTGNFFLTGTPLSQRAYEYNPEGVKTGNVVDMSQYGYSYRLQAGPNNELIDYQGGLEGHGLMKFTLSGEVIESLPAGFSNVFNVDPVSGIVFSARYEEGVEYDPHGNELPGLLYEGEPRWVAMNGVNGYYYLAYENRIAIFSPQTQVTLPDVQNEPPSEITGTSLKLDASVNPDGVTTSECVFEYGTVIEYGYIYFEEEAPCEGGQAISGSSPTKVSATLTGLTKGSTYYTRLKVANSNGFVRTKEQEVVPSEQAVVEDPYITDVHSDSVVFHFEITPEGAPTTYHVLYGTGDCTTEPETCDETPESPSVGAGLVSIAETTKATGLQAGTTYHYVIVATNQSGTSESTEETFTTFPYTPVLEDKCANAHVRQQTGAALLADCRAYELVSAANAGGYDVESYLNAEQEPFGGYPDAQDPTRVLYGVHDGAIPGSGHPTNHGLDPYVATRGADGWSTSYVGIPANLPYSAESFASPLAGADASLDTFAFGGSGLCSPCFADGTTGVPVALPNGELVQGMAGSLNAGPSATAAMLVKKPVSANGKHLIFGSSSEFESGAGSPAIYDRDLATKSTHAISKLPGGGSIPCLMDCTSDGLAELDVSADGSRVVIGQLISKDSKGNRYWHLYMNIGDSSKTVDLTPGTTSGAFYDGMTEDGSTVYFTTADRLNGEDSDNSADVYEAQVGASSATLHLVSKGSGGSGNSDSCSPLPNSVNQHWNTTAATANCDAVAVGGGGGVAAQNGSIYFLSPELLDGSSEPQDGEANQPNLYLHQPGSATPQFVSTLESGATGPNPALEEHQFKGTFGATENPEFVAVDNSGGPSDGDVYVADGNQQVIRKYDAEGHLITSWQNNGEFEPNLGHEFAGIAVGPNGVLYIAIHQENNSANRVFEYEEDGTFIAGNYVDGAPQPIGIAVDNQGRVYYEGYYGYIERWQKGKGSTIISTWEYESPPKTGVAVDPTTGTLYVGFGGVEVARFAFDSSGRVILPNGSTCNSECNPTETFGAGEVSNATEMFADPTRHEVYVDEGNKILRFHADGRRAPGPDVGAKVLSNSTSVAVSSAGNLYATNAGSEGANVASFGPLVLAPDPRTDSPLVVDSVNESGTRHTGDFQITPNGDDAVFTSTIPLTGYINGRHAEVFRYDATGEGLACVSCTPTNARSTGEASLARNGLSLTDDGRVFFNSTDPLVPSDLDNREDVYEWENGKTSLISTGVSPFNTSLLSATADGTDAYFFTRDTLVPQDINGSLVKVYDARENGGFPYVPPPPSCKASDECHGASSPTPAPQNVNTITGTGGNHVPGNEPTKTCPKGKVKRHGQCVKPHHRRKHHRKHRQGKRRSHGRSGGGQ